MREAGTVVTDLDVAVFVDFRERLVIVVTLVSPFLGIVFLVGSNGVALSCIRFIESIRCAFVCWYGTSNSSEPRGG